MHHRASGPKGDRGPSSLDWAILEGQETWGVTLLQANAEMDAGDIWASHTFPMRAEASKSSVYKEEAIEAAMRGLLEDVERFEGGDFTPETLDYARPDVVGRLRPPTKQEDRKIGWFGPSEDVLHQLRSADGNPGVFDEIRGLGVFLHGGYEEERLRGESGALIATRDGAVCRCVVPPRRTASPAMAPMGTTPWSAHPITTTCSAEKATTSTRPPVIAASSIPICTTRAPPAATPTYSGVPISAKTL